MKLRNYFFALPLLAPFVAHAATTPVSTTTITGSGLTISGQVVKTNVGPVRVETTNAPQTRDSTAFVVTQTSTPTLEITKPGPGTVGHADLVTYTQDVEKTYSHEWDSFDVQLTPDSSSLSGSEYIVYSGSIANDGISLFGADFMVTFSVYGAYKPGSYTIPGLASGATMNQASVQLSIGGGEFVTPVALTSEYDTFSGHYAVDGAFDASALVSPANFSLAFFAGDDVSITGARIGFYNYVYSESEKNIGQPVRQLLQTYEIAALAAVPEPDGIAFALAGLTALAAVVRRSRASR